MSSAPKAQDMAEVHSEAVMYNGVFDSVKAALEEAGITSAEAFYSKYIDWRQTHEEGSETFRKDMWKYSGALTILGDVYQLFGKHSLGLTPDQYALHSKRFWNPLSDMVAEAMLQNTDFDDADSVTALLRQPKALDRQFDKLSSGKYLSGTVVELATDKSLAQVLASDDFNVGGIAASALFADRFDVNQRVGVFKKLSEAKKDPNSKTEARDIYETSIAEQLVEADDIAQLIDLVREGHLETAHTTKLQHHLKPEQIIDILKLANKLESAETGLRYIDDPSKLRRLAEEASSFTRLSEETASEFATTATQLAAAIEFQPVIATVAPLTQDTENKFVVAMDTSSDEPKIVIAWSNKKDHFYHKEILRNYCSQNNSPRSSIKDSLVSGGHLAVEVTDGKTKVTFSKSSGDYGRYSPKLMQKYSEHIEAALAESLGVDELSVSFV